MGVEKEYGQSNAGTKGITKEHELRVISALKFSSFLSIFIKF